MDKTTLLEQIKRTRKSKGLTQAELAERLGKSEMTIRRWESGERSPRMEEIQKIAQVLNISVSELLSDTTEVNDLPVRPNTEQNDKLPFKNTGNALIYERNGERLELPPTEESYKIFRYIAMRIAERSNTPAIA